MSEGLEALRLLSANMGSDWLLVQGSGGNTSLKDNGIIWVKASGKSLAKAKEENIFLPLDLKKIHEDIHRFGEMTVDIQSQVYEGLLPSIETTMHALMPHNVVLHSHPIDIIATSLIPEARAKLRLALVDIAWHWIPYCRPGMPLTREVRSALAKHPADVLILANHGLVVGATNTEEAALLQQNVVNRLRRIPREFTISSKLELMKELTSMDVAYIPYEPVIHSLAADPWSFELAKCNPAYPDHVVFCGVRPWVVEGTRNPPSVETAYGLVPGVGVILLPAATAATEAMLRAQAEVYLRIPPGTAVNLLSDSQCAELINWDAEKYRKALEKAT